MVFRWQQNKSKSSFLKIIFKIVFNKNILRKNLLYSCKGPTKPRTGDASIRKPQCVRREEVRTARAPACSQTHLKHQKVLCEVAGGGRKLRKDNAEKCLSKFWCLPKILTNIPTILKACVDQSMSLFFQKGAPS